MSGRLPLVFAGTGAIVINEMSGIARSKEMRK
jgi:hypothetical protein